MNDKPILFSVVIPTYNRAGLLTAAIDSILKQSFQSFEILVVDDGSTDHTAELIKTRYGTEPKLRYIYQENAERGAARNRGAREARGEYLNFFDSDDIMYPHHLQEAHRFIAGNSPDIFHLNFEIKDEAGNLLRKGPAYHGLANRHLIKGNLLSCDGVILKRSLALDAPFNENRDLAGLEDWELWLRLAARHEIPLLPAVSTCIVEHSGRSVLTTEKSRLVKRVNTLMHLVSENEMVSAFYGKELKKFRASCYSYIALHIALTKKDRKDTASYLLKSIITHPASLFSRRSLAIFKHFF